MRHTAAVEFPSFAGQLYSVQLLKAWVSVFYSTLNLLFQTALLLLRFKDSLQHVTCDMFAPDGSSNAQF